MDEQQKAIFDQQMKLKRGAAIIEGTQNQFRQDGYSNLLNKFGTKQDNSMAYQYNGEPFADDMELVRLYEGNGLFTKIINRPAEEAVKHGLDIDFGDEDISEYVDDRLDELEYEDKFATAEKWARLYGGSIIVMLVNDGRGLDEPLDLASAKSIEELRVFERAIVQPDYTALYNFHFEDSMKNRTPFGEPEYYQVFSTYGYFRVHHSRCLVFRNGKLPEQTTNANYRYWGIPEYVKIKRALRECITAHEDGVKLLERSVQAIYKMKNLANMLATSDGEDKVLQRLQVIDMARGILNSIAIDTEGEDYNFESLTMSGVKDVLDSTCNMLSAVTDIPQTILFGRSPSGMNSTGESDMENYYNMVENIQKQNMKANTRKIVDLILKQGVCEGSIQESPKYKMKFAALWSMTEAEQANTDAVKANTEHIKAQTAQIYAEMNVLDPTEIRNSLASEGKFEIEEVLSDEDLNLPDDTFDLGETISIDVPEDTAADAEGLQIFESGAPLPETDGKITIEMPEDMEIHIRTDDKGGGAFSAAAVIIIKDGKILCATRSDTGEVCGPGGKAEVFDRTSEDTAVREALEEFKVIPYNLIPLGNYKGSSSLYLPSKIYFTDDFTGTPEADEDEMFGVQWLTLQELRSQKLFPPFEASLDMLENFLGNYLTTSNSTDTITAEKISEDLFDVDDEEWICTNSSVNTDGGEGSGYFEHPGNPGNVGGSRKRGSFSDNFPKVCVHTNGRKMKSHPDYNAAKKGDYESAERLVRDIVKPERIKQIAESYPDAKVVPVQSSGKGHNQIPVALANEIGKEGLEVDNGIQIIEKANRTGSSELHRLTSANKISGEIEKNRKYVIVDDVVTSGASINEYRMYIEERGGIVVAATSLCMGQAGSNQIAPKADIISKTIEKHGAERIERVCKSIGIEYGLESMTNWQVNYLRSCASKTLDKLAEEGE